MHVPVLYGVQWLSTHLQSATCQILSLAEHVNNLLLCCYKTWSLFEVSLWPNIPFNSSLQWRNHCYLTMFACKQPINHMFTHVYTHVHRWPQTPGVQVEWENSPETGECNQSLVFVYTHIYILVVLYSRKFSRGSYFAFFAIWPHSQKFIPRIC